MEVYNLILSNSARDGVKIRKNEVYSLVLSFWPWRCTFCPWRGLILALVVHVLPLAWAEFGLWWCNVGLGNEKKKVARNFLKFGMEVYNLILSNSARDGVKIRKNEVYGLVLSFWPWRCTFCPWRGLSLALVLHVLPLAWAEFGLGCATLASETKKKKVARNFLKFCMEVYNLILSNSARGGVKIRKNEVYGLVLSFWPWRCTFCPWRGLSLALVLHVLPLAWAEFGLGCATLASETEKKKVARNFLKFCMEVYNLILSNSARDGVKLCKNEVYSLVLRLWP
jgi:hypothetical protein